MAHPDSAQANRSCGAPGTQTSLVSFKQTARHAFAEHRWRDPTPVKDWERTKMRRAKQCPLRSATPMRRFERQERERFMAYRHERRAQEKLDAQYAAITPPGHEYLAGLRECESGGNYSTNTGNGYYGAYQFDLQTWASVGGSGYPHLASPAEQDYRAALLWRSRGSSPWPVCG